MWWSFLVEQPLFPCYCTSVYVLIEQPLFPFLFIFKSFSWVWKRVFGWKN